MVNQDKNNKYQTVSLAIATRIRCGDFSGRRSLPSELRLAADYGVGRNTVRRALAALAESGLITKRQGNTSLIRNTPPARLPLRRKRAGKMVWLTDLPHAALDDNSLYLEFFRLLSVLCDSHDLALDFISMTDPHWYDFYQSNSYIATFIAGGNRERYSKYCYDRICEIDNLIVLDDLHVPPWRFSIGTDHRSSARTAVRHLLAAGHTRIGFLCSKQPYTPLYPHFAERRIGYEMAMAEAGLPVSEENFWTVTCHHLNYLLEDLRKDVSRIRQFDAFFAVTDLLAVLLVQLAREEHVRVPEELSVIGFDGWRGAQLLAPRIATIRHPAEEIALSAFKLALQLAGGKKPPREKHIYMEGSLITGETVFVKQK